MSGVADLKSLIALLAPEPRLAIIEAVCRSPGSTTADIAHALSLSEHESEHDLAALREHRVLVLRLNGWHISPHVQVRIDGAFMRFAADARDGCGLRLRVPLRAHRPLPC